MLEHIRADVIITQDKFKSIKKPPKVCRNLFRSKLKPNIIYKFMFFLKRPYVSLATVYLLVPLLASEQILFTSAQHQQNQYPQQQLNDDCQSASSLASFLCKAGQSVISGATRFASTLLERPKHWGVPDSEQLELEEDYNKHQFRSPSNGLRNHPNNIATNNNNNNFHNQNINQRLPTSDSHHHQQYQQQQKQGLDIVIDENYLRGYGHKKRRRAQTSSPNTQERINAINENSHCLLRNAVDGIQKSGICMPIHACYHKHGNSIRYQLDGNSSDCLRAQSLVCCPIRVDHRTISASNEGLNKDNDDEDNDDDDDSNKAKDSSGQRFSMLRLAAESQEKAGKIAIDTLRKIVSQVFDESNGRSSQSDINNDLERNIVNEGFTLRRDSPSDLHQRFIQLRNSKLISKLAKDGSDFLEIATRLAKQKQQTNDKFNVSDLNCAKIAEKEKTSRLSVDGICKNNAQRFNHEDETSKNSIRRRDWLPEIDFSQTELSSRCPGDPICQPDAAVNPYRTYDGSCNNLFHTAWGKSNTPYTRILPPDYEDGVNELRKTGVTGALLPNARSVSLASVNWSDKADSRASLMLMQWGQFVDHDITLAATTPMLTPQGTSIDCCNRRLLTDPRFKHPACISVLLPDLDPFYSPFKVGCMNMVRSAPSPPIGCRLRGREQLNQLTHFIDGSMIYGNDEQQALGLRQFHSGLLKSSRVNGAEFLPFDGRLGEGCILPSDGIKRGMRCFVAGDNRVNELTGLVTTHAMFLREHNRIARILTILNREWTDEQLYQEARRIVIAEIQHITYNEWLPIILGPVVMRDFKLKLQNNLKQATSNEHDQFDLYDPETEPTIINEFAGAAYRLHSLVQSAFNFQTEDGQLIQQFKLRNIFNNPASLYREGNYDGCIHSMINEPSQSVDQHFTEELTNHLFQDTNSSFGMDLVTVNIQRGRDHGIPGYNFFRQACGLTKIKSFDQLDSVMVEGASRIFGQLYAHVDDIDLFIAGSYEKKLKDAMIGPVFACIIGEQFRRLKVGDRYWYENSQQAGSFTPTQLAQIRRVSMGRIICDNSDFIERIQPLAFLRPHEWNPKVPCENLPWLDLRAWSTRATRQQQHNNNIVPPISDQDHLFGGPLVNL